MKKNEQLPETVQPGEVLSAVQLCPFGTGLFWGQALQNPLQQVHRTVAVLGDWR